MDALRPHPERRRRAAGRAPTARILFALCAAAVLAGCTPSPSSEFPSRTTGPHGPSDTASTTTPTTGLIPPESGAASETSTGGAPKPTTPPGPPPAAMLDWLSGAATEGGVLVGAKGNQRWVGRIPGEYAILGDGWYRYFGADGSLVGCTSGGQCVGVGADGQVAVTSGPDAPRAVYDADGSAAGSYEPDGTKLSGRPDHATLAEAIRATGVDVAGLVDAATRSAPFAGGVTGDPHLITAGGVRWTTQAVGQFVARNGDAAHRIQLEFQPMAHRDDVSIATTVAIGTGTDTVVIDLDGTVTVNGHAQPHGGDFRQVALAHGVALGLWPMDAHGVMSAVVVWPDGGTVAVTAHRALGLTVVAHLDPAPEAAGLFGAARADVVPAGEESDLISRQGTAGSVSDVVASWRVRPEERLLPAPSGLPPVFPQEAASIDPGAAKVARQACSGHGMTKSEDIAACSFDVALTGDTGFVAGHVAMAVPAESGRVASSFAARWPALTAGSLAGAPELPETGRLDLSLAPGSRHPYLVTLERAGAIGLTASAGCADGKGQPGMDDAAMRVFDIAGHAVSDRFALCGRHQTGMLRPGRYAVVLANGTDRPALAARVDVAVP